MEILGLSHEQCFGTDEQKNSLTKLNWKDMPDYGIPEIYKAIESCDDEIRYTYPKAGFMTAREVMQYIGTDIFRKMNKTVWVDALINQIKIEQPELSIVCDVRFPGEVEAIQEAGGKVIRLERSPFKDDEHESEKALDNINFHWSKFDAVIGNQAMSIPEQNESIYKTLRQWDYIPELEE